MDISEPSLKLDALRSRIATCRLCAEALPHPPRPVVQAGGGARILVIGQAPGRKVHLSGIPWDDASGDRLRAWMGLAKPAFYDPQRLAIMPMGFCYPGAGAKGNGDNPPMRPCAPTWHSELVSLLPEVRLTLLIGHYAQAYYLPKPLKSMTETVRSFDGSSPLLPLPHPSWRVVRWMRDNPWFEARTLPLLRQKVADALAD